MENLHENDPVFMIRNLQQWLRVEPNAIASPCSRRDFSSGDCQDY
jgi:hypothetical protein